MEFETIAIERKEKVATIRFNRPSNLNAFNDLMISESIQALNAFRDDAGTRCIVMTGEGRAFSAGQDLKSAMITSGDVSFSEHLRQGYNELVLLMTQLEKPIIAAVNGIAAGAGFGVALAADIRLVSPKATFMLAFSRLGLIPDSGLTWFLPRLMGYGRAFEKAVTAEQISADEALSWGLANTIIPHEQLMAVTHAWALRLAEGSAIAIALTKQAMYRAMSKSLEEALEDEASLQDVAGKTGDFIEGVDAFLQKREPDFSH